MKIVYVKIVWEKQMNRIENWAEVFWGKRASSLEWALDENPWKQVGITDAGRRSVVFLVWAERNPRRWESQWVTKLYTYIHTSMYICIYVWESKWENGIDKRRQLSIGSRPRQLSRHSPVPISFSQIAPIKWEDENYFIFTIHTYTII